MFPEGHGHPRVPRMIFRNQARDSPFRRLHTGNDARDDHARQPAGARPAVARSAPEDGSSGRVLILEQCAAVVVLCVRRTRRAVCAPPASGLRAPCVRTGLSAPVCGLSAPVCPHRSASAPVCPHRSALCPYRSCPHRSAVPRSARPLRPAVPRSARLLRPAHPRSARLLPRSRGSVPSFTTFLALETLGTRPELDF